MGVSGPVLVLVAAAVLAAACGDGDGIVRTPVVEAPQAEVVEFTAGGVELSGFAFGDTDTAVVLAHMQGGAKEDWIDVAIALGENGVSALTFDFRGYAGQAGKKDKQLVADLQAAVQAMRDRGATRVYVVGASSGAAAAVAVAAREDLAGVVSVSAPSTFATIKARRDAVKIEEPSVFVAAADDQPFARHAKTLAGAAAGRLVTYPGAAHGTDLLGEHGDALTALIVGFVKDPTRPGVAPAPPS